MRRIYNHGANNSSRITCYVLEPHITPKAIIYFAHGVTEYAMRYEEMFLRFVDDGYIVCANDHMGHGPQETSKKMFFQGHDLNKIDESGWDCACDDAYYCIQRAQEVAERPLPVIGIGFSLGSFIIRTLAIRRPELFKAIVLIGTNNTTPLAIKLGKMVAMSEGYKHGFNTRVKKIDDLTFGSYNKHFEKKTRVDWLCENKSALQTYLTDKNIGFGFTPGLFYHLLCGMEFTTKDSNIAKMNKGTKILLIAGDKDPVGNFTKSVKKLKTKYDNAGLSTRLLIFPGRHDILHENCADEVIAAMLSFLVPIK